MSITPPAREERTGRRQVRATSPHRHPSQHRRTILTPARLAISIVEGRGIWIELGGDLVDGSLDQVRTRFDRLAELGFDVVVVDTDEIRTIDRCGADLLGGFVDRVTERRGDVVIVDRHGIVAPAGERLTRATVTCRPPEGAWWLP